MLWVYLGKGTLVSWVMVVGMIIFPKARCVFGLCYKELPCVCETELAVLDPLKDEVSETAQYEGENVNSV